MQKHMVQIAHHIHWPMQVLMLLTLLTAVRCFLHPHNTNPPVHSPSMCIAFMAVQLRNLVEATVMTRLGYFWTWGLCKCGHDFCVYVCPLIRLRGKDELRPKHVAKCPLLHSLGVPHPCVCGSGPRV